MERGRAVQRRKREVKTYRSKRGCLSKKQKRCPPGSLFNNDNAEKSFAGGFARKVYDYSEIQFELHSQIQGSERSTESK